MDELEVFRQQIEVQRAELLRMGFQEVTVERLQPQGEEREPLVVVSACFEGQGVSFYLQPAVVPRLAETLQERPPMYRASNLRILQVMQATLLEQEVARAVSLLESGYPERRIEHLELPGEGVGRKVEIYDRRGGEMRFWIRFRYQEPEVDIFQVTPEVPEIVAECGSPRQSKPIRTERVRLRGEGAHSVAGVLEVATRFVEAEDAWSRMKERVKQFFR